MEKKVTRSIGGKLRLADFKNFTEKNRWFFNKLIDHMGARPPYNGSLIVPMRKGELRGVYDDSKRSGEVYGQFFSGHRWLVASLFEMSKKGLNTDVKVEIAAGNPVELVYLNRLRKNDVEQGEKSEDS